MPARKSKDSADGEDGKDGFGVEDLSLPRTMIQRLAKGVLPANTQIQKDALLAMSKSATVFVNYLASSANENALIANKKTIQPRDVFDAMHNLEFAAFLPRLEQELIKYNTVQCDKRNTYRRKVREEQPAKKAEAAAEALNGTRPEGDGDAGADGEQIATREADEEPAAKKVRRSSVDGGDAEAPVEIEDDTMDQEEDEQDEEEEDGEDDDAGEDEDEEGGDEQGEEPLMEDPLEERETEGIGDDASEGDDSD